MDTTVQPAPGEQGLQSLLSKLHAAIERLESARKFARSQYQLPVLELTRRTLAQPGGLEAIYPLAPRMDRAGIFLGTDWEHPGTLLPSLVRSTLEAGDRSTFTIECLSELRLLAIARGESQHAGVSAESARHFLTQVLALNLDHLFHGLNETTRIRLGPLGDVLTRLFRFLAEYVGFENILENLMTEIWRLLAQRPIQVSNIKAMVTQVAMAAGQQSSESRQPALGTDRLVSGLFGPTDGCRDDPGLELYAVRLGSMDAAALKREAFGFARAMHDVGLVADYHAVFLRWLMDNGHETLIPDTLGLSSTGLDAFRSYHDLVHALICEAVHVSTAQCIYGLALLLERGTLYAPPIAPALWRQIRLKLSESVEATIGQRFGHEVPGRVILLAGVISVLGQPLGVSQGNNPACQSTRAISMWATNDPDYLLHLVSQAARFDGILMHFEGEPVLSAELTDGLMMSTPIDIDPVSTLLVPHLDRIYHEMGKRCADRGEDPHRWINPEFHGWWVGRDFLIAVDIHSGSLINYDAFLLQFFNSYHPYYNGNQPIIHPQPAGIAITDSQARFVGWHAISLLRVALDHEGVMRVYFYNPNNDSGQDWGNGVIVSTRDQGERFGESSLPFVELASRLYLFHDDPVEELSHLPVPQEKIEQSKLLATESWAAERMATSS